MFNFLVLAVVLFGCDRSTPPNRDVVNMVPLAVLQEPQSGRDIGAVRFSPDQAVLALAELRSIKLWTIADRTFFKRVSVSPLNAYSFEFLSDKDTIVRGGNFDECALWDLDGEKSERIQLPQHDGYITSMGYRSDDRVILVGGTDVVIVIWNPVKRQIEEILKTNTKSVRTAVSRNGDVVLLVDAGETLTMWSTSKRRQLKTFNVNKKNLSAIGLSADGSMVACGFLDGEIKVIRVADGREIGTVMHGVPVSAIAFSPDGALLAVVGSKHNASPGHIRIVDLGASSVVATAQRDAGGGIRCLDFSADGSLLATASIRGEVCLWDVQKIFSIE
jgi:WD40 repeat protein